MDPPSLSSSSDASFSSEVSANLLFFFIAVTGSSLSSSDSVLATFFVAVGGFLDGLTLGSDSVSSLSFLSSSSESLGVGVSLSNAFFLGLLSSIGFSSDSVSEGAF